MMIWTSIEFQRETTFTTKAADLWVQKLPVNRVWFYECTQSTVTQNMINTYESNSAKYDEVNTRVTKRFRAEIGQSTFFLI